MSNSNTYLFTWNPQRWEWKDIEEYIENINTSGKANIRWSCGNTNNIKKGDRAFLMRLGEAPKGIIGSGYITSSPVIQKHWSGESKKAKYVNIDFESLLNPEKDKILTLEEIKKHDKLSSQNWTPQASGISIQRECKEYFEKVWFDFLTTQNIRYVPFLPDEVEDGMIYDEGTPIQINITRYERNPYARKRCISIYGLNCSVCNFNFNDVYGEIGANFIHVHHVKQLSDIAKSYKVNPDEDLRPVCPNCHAMLHKKNPAYTIEELKEKLNILPLPK